MPSVTYGIGVLPMGSGFDSLLPKHESLLKRPLNGLFYLFAFGVPLCRGRRYVSVALKTDQGAYAPFRHTIYDHTPSLTA